MLSGEFTARSVRDGEARTVTFAKGLEVSDKWESGVREKNGTFISFRVDEEVFGEYATTSNTSSRWCATIRT